jgi:integrase
MKKQRQPFGLFLKRLACGTNVFYYWTYDSDGKRRQFSTGLIDKKEAMREVLNRMKDGKLVPIDKTVLRIWTNNWFVYNDCPYIQSRKLRGFEYSMVHAANKRSMLIRFIWPTFGDRLLDSIQPRHIEEWLGRLINDGNSRDLVNRCLGTIRLIFGEATRLGIIEKNPAINVLPLKHSSSEKGILTDQEAELIFDVKNRAAIWGHRIPAFWALLLAHLGGLRQGELLALQVEDILSNGLAIKHGWDRLSGIKGTKNGHERFVPIPAWVLDAIRKTAGTGHVFSLCHGDRPISPTYLQKAFSLAMENIGINRAQQIERHLGTHSLRHGFVSRMLAAGVPPAVVAEVVGHQNLSMTIGTYHHATPIHARLVAQVQDSAYPRPEFQMRVSGY